MDTVMQRYQFLQFCVQSIDTTFLQFRFAGAVLLGF